MGELFERQVAAADATRASLTYKKLARYANPTWEQKVRFGQLLEHSNKKLAIGTYENALEDLQRQGKKEETLLVLGRIVSLEPSQPNHLRVAELSAELGEHVMRRNHFAIGGTGGNIAKTPPHGSSGRTRRTDGPEDRGGLWQEPVVTGRSGAAIFTLSRCCIPNASLTTELYAGAVVRGPVPESEPRIWQIFEQNWRDASVVNLIGKMIDLNWMRRRWRWRGS